MYRVEEKYLCSERDMLLLQSRVKVVLKPDAFSGDVPYRITSLYFDDASDSHLSDSEDGVCYRNKYRIRIYNNSLDVIKLEVKYKAYNRVFKKSKGITVEEATRLIAGECIEDNAISIDNPVTLFNLAIKKDFLRSTVIVDYIRNAYVFSPGNVRITFDRNVQTSNNIGSFLDCNCSFYMLRDTNRILEVKYDEFLPRFIAQMLEFGCMNQTAYSKYQLCREQLEVYR